MSLYKDEIAVDILGENGGDRDATKRQALWLLAEVATRSPNPLMRQRAEEMRRFLFTGEKTFGGVLYFRPHSDRDYDSIGYDNCSEDLSTSHSWVPLGEAHAKLGLGYNDN